MIRFVDIATDAKPKKAPAPTSDAKAMPVVAAAETTKSAKAPRKPKKTS